MDKRKLIIIIGVTLIVLGFIFSSPDWSSRQSIMHNIGEAEIVILEGQRVSVPPTEADVKSGNVFLNLNTNTFERMHPAVYKGRLAIPLRYVLSLGIVFIAIGISMLTIYQKRKSSANL